MGHRKVFGKLEKIKQNDEKSIQKLRILFDQKINI